MPRPIKKATVTGPTPPHILKAIKEIAAYCREGNFEQAIISRSGGAAFLLTDIYEQVLGKDVVKSVKKATREDTPFAYWDGTLGPPPKTR